VEGVLVARLASGEAIVTAQAKVAELQVCELERGVRWWCVCLVGV
jgi:hypothetical protein